MKRVAVKIDAALTKAPKLLNRILGRVRGEFDTILAASTTPELGGWVENFKYRLDQLEKMGVSDFDALLVTEEDQIRKACEKLGVGIMVDNSGEKSTLALRLI